MTKKQLYKDGIIFFAIGLLVAGALLLIYFLGKNHKNPYSYSYKSSQLVAVTLPGSGVGHGLYFKHPLNFTAINPIGAKDAATFAQDVTKNNTTVTIGGESAAIVPTSGDYLTVMAYYLGQTPGSAAYQKGISGLQAYINAELKYIFLYADKNPQLSLALSPPKSVAEVGLPHGAWVFNYTAKAPSLQSEPAKVPTLKGELIFAVGKTDYYYVLLGTADYNWDSNSAAWKTVLSSLLIDL